MQKKLFLVLLFVSLFLGISSYKENVAYGENSPKNIEIQDIVNSEETDKMLLDEMNNTISTKPRTQNIDEISAKSPYEKLNQEDNVVPKIHKELFGVAFMFIKVMIAVGVASVIIYFLLLFVRRFYGENVNTNIPTWDDEVDLRTPKNDSSALKGFLNQTKNLPH